jgi:hypothetical protein
MAGARKTFTAGMSEGWLYLHQRGIAQGQIPDPQENPTRDRMRAKLDEVKRLRLRRHQPIPGQGEWLQQVVAGHFAYYAVPTNSRALSAFRHNVVDLWRRSLWRRSQKDRTTWDRVKEIADDWLPKPRILHPWPNQRFAVTHAR